MKIPLYIPEPLAGVDLALWFKPANAGLFNEEFPPNFFETSVERVLPEGAKAIVLPNNFLKALTKQASEYIAHYADLGEKLGIPVYVFSIGDFTDRLRFDPRVTVFTFSVYRSSVPTNTVVIPTLVADNAKAGITIRPKADIPVVSFCGQAGYQTTVQWIKYYLKVSLGLTLSFFKPSRKARLIGVYWRRRALAVCRKSAVVHSLFIIRRSFSGAHKTIELDPVVARKEFIQSITEADFVLAPKGDGNYSNRFLEALGHGRVPVLIDTDTVLPLESVIDYEKIMVKVPMRDVANTPAYIRAFYDKLDDARYAQVQREARAIFENYLRQDSFFAYYFGAIAQLKNI